MRLLTVLIIFSITLAGCSSDKEPAKVGPGDGLEPTADTGIIRGVVVDAAVIPLEGVTVTVDAAGKQTSSDGDGKFGFAGLEPGQYTVTAEKFGFVTAKTSVPVAAGVAEPPIVRVQLTPIPNFDPYAHTIVHDGIYQCGTSVVVVCAAPAIVLGFAGQPDPLGLDSSTHTFYFGAGVQFVQSEMIWDSTQAVSPELTFEQEGLDEGCTTYSESEALEGAYGMGYAKGGSPLRTRVGADVLEEHNVNPDDCGIYYSVFAGGAQGTPAGISIQQPFTWFITEFHGFDPADDWWYLTDGDHPLPR